MGLYQRINQIIEEHKELLIATGIAAIIASEAYINNAYAGNAYDTKTGKAAIVTQSGSSQIGLTPNDIIIFQNRQNIGVDSKGNTYIRQGPSIAEAAEEMNRQTQQTKTPPIYNFKTAQEYINEIKEAYKKDQYQKIVDLSNDALERKEALKINPQEIKKLENYKGIGVELVEKLGKGK